MAYTRNHAYGAVDEVPPGGGSAAQRERARTQDAVRKALGRLNERDGVLDLSYTALVHQGKEFALSGTIFHLKKLDLTSCGLGPQGIGALIGAFGRGFGGPNLQALVLAQDRKSVV